MGSRPPFSASVRGITSSASAKAVTASCSLPLSVAAYSFNLSASSTSGEPPPATSLPSSMTTPTTLVASSKAVSTLFTTCSVLPLRITDTAFGFLHLVTNVVSSPPILRSSTRPANPRSDSDISLILLTIVAPVARAIFSKSLFRNLRIPNIPSFAR